MRFDLEGASPSIADVDDARILAGPLQHAPAAGRQPLQMHARGFVRAVLAPHHAEDAQFGDSRFASAEKCFYLLVFFRREAVFADDFWSNGKSGNRGHGEALLSHLRRAEERSFPVAPIIFFYRGNWPPFLRLGLAQDFVDLRVPSSHRD